MSDITVQRYDSISTLPSSKAGVEIVSSVVPQFSSLKKSVVNKKYFIPLSEQSKSVRGQLPPVSEFTFKDGKDDGRSAALRRRGLDLSERQAALGDLVSEIKDRSADAKDDIALAKKIKESSKASYSDKEKK